MLEYDVDESIGCWVASTSHALRRAMTAELSRIGITFRQFEVLAWTVIEGEQSQVELADRMGIEAPTLAGILSRMERDGWLERHCCSEDRRKKRIRPTERAESVWNQCVECCHRVREQVTRGISSEELAAFRSVCERIKANVAMAEELEPAR